MFVNKVLASLIEIHCFKTRVFSNLLLHRIRHHLNKRIQEQYNTPRGWADDEEMKPPTTGEKQTPAC